jgi:hypothetical protein
LVCRKYGVMEPLFVSQLVCRKYGVMEPLFVSQLVCRKYHSNLFLLRIFRKFKFITKFNPPNPEYFVFFEGRGVSD